MTTNPWPALPLAEWKDTYDTLHMWTQIVGKIRLALTPFVNHWWNATLYVTPRGLTTSAMPYNGRLFQIDFDFIAQLLLIVTTDDSTKTIALRPRSVAEFYQETMAALGSLGMPVTIWTTPVEVPDRIPFEQDPGAPNCARFVQVEAYSHEVSSCGFWPGGGLVDEPVFYSYAYPEPQGFKDYPIQPQEAFYHTEMREFLLPYDVVRTAKLPDEVLLAFLQSTYEAAATLAKWDRRALERQ